MDDGLLVGGVQRVGDLSRDGQRLANRKRAAVQPIGERFALHELEDQRPDRGLPGSRRRVDLLDAMNGADMRMIERGQDARLALEAREAIRIGREQCRQQLDGDVSIEPGVARAIHLAHASSAKL